MKQTGSSVQYQVNFRLLAGTVVVAALLACGLYFWHGFALERVATGFYDRARQALSNASGIETEAAKVDEKKRDGMLDNARRLRREATDLLWQYIQVKGDDPAARIDLALAYADLPEPERKLRRAMQLFRSAISQADGEREWELRIRLADLLIEGGEFAEAESEGRAIVKASKTEGRVPAELAAKGWSVLGISLANQIIAGGRKDKSAVLKEFGDEDGVVFVESRSKNPDDWKLAVALGSLYRSAEGESLLTESQREAIAASGQSLAEFADEIALGTIAKHPGDANALTSGFLYRKQWGLEGEGDDILAAVRTDPKNGDLLTLAGIWCLEKIPAETRVEAVAAGSTDGLSVDDLKQLSEADEYLTQAFDGGTEAPELFAALADVRQIQSRPDDARKVLEIGIESTSFPGALLYQRLVFMSINEGKFDIAEQEIAQWREKTTGFSRLSNVDLRLLSESTRQQDMLEGILELNRKRLDKAVAVFEKLIVAEGRKGPRVVEAYRLLGGAFANSGLPARAAHYLELASVLDPGDAELLRQAARFRLAMGQVELAREHFERVVNSRPTTQDLFEYARILYESRMRIPREERQWLDVENAINRAKSGAGEADEELMQSWHWLESAVALEKSPADWTPPEKLYGTEPASFAITVANWYRTANKAEQADDLWNSYVAKGDNAFEKVRLQVQQFIELNQLDDAEKVILQAETASPEPEQQLVLRRWLARIDLLRGNPDAAWGKLEDFARKFPEHYPAIITLGNLAIESNRVAAEPAWWEERLVQAEGADGPLQGLLAATRKLQLAMATDDDGAARIILDEAAGLLDQVMVRQSRWLPAIVLKGRLFDEQLRRAAIRQDEAAVSRLRQQAESTYRQAVELGDRAPFTLLRLSELMDDPAEAARILGMLDDDVIARFDSLLDRWVSVGISSGNIKSAEEIARSATEMRPGDVNAWLSLARVLVRQDRHSEAREEAQRAKEIAMGDSGSSEDLMAVFRFYVTAQYLARNSENSEPYRTEARALIDRLAELEPEATRPFLRGVLHDSIDDDEAASWYLRYADSKPANVNHIEVMVDFFRRRNVPGINSQDMAIQLASRLVELKPDSAEYRAGQARLLMARGRQEDWDQATKLLIDLEQFGPQTVPGKRARAILAWERRDVPKSARKQYLEGAVAQLSEIIGTPDATPVDNILLGNIYLELAELADPADASGKSELRTLAADAAGRARQAPQLSVAELLDVCRLLIELESWDEAQRTIDELSARLNLEQVPNPAALALAVTLWKKRGDEGVPEKARPLLIDFIGQSERDLPRLDDGQRAQMFFQIASTWEMIGDRNEALIWYQKASDLEPANFGSLIFALVRDGQKKTALDLCTRSFKKRPTVDTVFLLAQILNSGRTPADIYEAAEPLMDQIWQKFSNDLIVIGTLANIRSCQPGKTDVAIELYRSGLASNPDDFVLLNNLATVYGEMPEHQDEAITMIDRAIRVRGDLPDLLNTRARILANQGKLAEARDLLMSIVRRQADPRFWWHLAEIETMLHEQNGQVSHREASEAAWKEAVRNGIEFAVLTPAEVDRLEAMRVKFEDSSN